MTSISPQDILFDDFALLEQHIGRQQLIARSVNTNCDCASSPTLSANSNNFTGYSANSHDDNHDPNQIAPSVGQAD